MVKNIITSLVPLRQLENHGFAVIAGRDSTQIICIKSAVLLSVGGNGSENRNKNLLCL